MDLSLCRIGQAISTQFWLPTHCALGATSIKDFIRPNRFMPSSELTALFEKVIFECIFSVVEGCNFEYSEWGKNAEVKISIVFRCSNRPQSRWPKISLVTLWFVAASDLFLLRLFFGLLPNRRGTCYIYRSRSSTCWHLWCASLQFWLATLWWHQFCKLVLWLHKWPK